LKCILNCEEFRHFVYIFYFRGCWLSVWILYFFLTVDARHKADRSLTLIGTEPWHFYFSETTCNFV